jgi:hypothetical protein
MLGLCENKIKDIGIIWRDKEQIVTKAINGIQLKPIDQLGFELFDGDYNPVWGYLASKHPDQALHYPYLDMLHVLIMSWEVAQYYRITILK